MPRLVALIVLLLVLGPGCSSGHAYGDNEDAALQRQMSDKGWSRDTRARDRSMTTPLPSPARTADEMIIRASGAWGINQRKLRRLALVDGRVDPVRLDLLAAASASSGVPPRYLVPAMLTTAMQASRHDLSFSHHMAMIATLAMFDHQPHVIHDNFNLAVDGLASAFLPAGSTATDLPGRILALDEWRHSHDPGPQREGCLDALITSPEQRRAVVMLLQDPYMVVFCDLVGSFGCSPGQAWRQVGSHPLPDGTSTSNQETWRMQETARHAASWLDR